MKKFAGYIRVSTAKQGEGVSLEAQRDAIQRYADRNGLPIDSWFEEKETAAKRGRPIFNQMLKLLKTGKIDGVIIHKIDRSARNLKDWADLGEMIDQGIEVHFVNESLDLHSRGGRLSADIQAVVAADYIRNLREETRKGFYGRIKQGFYPLPAPVGYIDMGKGKAKELDPVKAPLIRKAFELYATGMYNLKNLRDEMYRLGLRNKNGGKVTLNGISIALNNPFYFGLIRLRKTGETFVGSHDPIIPKSLFDRVLAILNGKTNTRSKKHRLVFSRLVKCRSCNYSLIGEVQKGFTYYRCQTKDCPKTCIREENFDKETQQRFKPLTFSEEELNYLRSKMPGLKEDWQKQQEDAVNAVNLKLSNLADRLTRLTDAYLDGVLEKQIFEERKPALLLERKDMEEKRMQLTNDNRSIPEKISEFLELAGNAYFLYKNQITEEKRDLIKDLTSNRSASGENVEFMLAPPFDEIAKRYDFTNGAPYRDIPRTLDRLIEKLMHWFKENPVAPTLASQNSLSEFSKGIDKEKDRKFAA